MSEHFYGMTISSFLDWVQENTSQNWVFIDTETTGLKGSKVEQLTQVAAISTILNTDDFSFTEIDLFNKKIKLTDNTLERIKSGEDIERILEMNHYRSNGSFYYNESLVLNWFNQWILSQGNLRMIMQNVRFDLDMLNGRDSNVNFNQPTFDTKALLQMFYLPLIQTLAESDDKYKGLVEKIGTTDRDGGLISSSLSRVGPALKLNMSTYHDAFSDCRITISMVNKIFNLLRENWNVDISFYQKERIKTKEKRVIV